MSVTVALPDSSEQALEIRDQDGVFTATFEQTDRSGLYRLTPLSASLPPETFAVNVPSAESDLTAIDRQSLQTTLFPDVEFAIRAADDPAPVFAALEYESGFSIISRGLAIAVLILLLVEPLMAWRFRAGAVALSAALIAALLSSLIGYAAAIAIVLMLTGTLAWRRSRMRAA